MAEAPLVQQAYRKFADRLSVAGVVSGPDESVDEYKLGKVITDLGLTYPQVRDRDLGLTHLFRVKGTPDVVLLNANRKVVYRGHSLPTSLEPFL
ncbi:MAG: hypothetical protein P1V35_10225 [Planctomycetota bacterium]|nr:hypothetical protein [Planctomycetota bacterium]